MARIRSIKPEFFIDEELQDLEADNPGAYCMLVFAGLWGHCSSNGVFEWRPRTLKLHILPFLPFDISDTLLVLVEAGFIRRFSSDGRDYGYIPSFSKHQRISGKEAQESPKYPCFSQMLHEETTGKQQGSNGEAVETAGKERKGKERKREKEKLAIATEVKLATAPPVAVEVSGQASAVSADSVFSGMIRKAVIARHERLRELFPHVNLQIETEKMCVKYRDGPVLDAGLLVLNWLQRIPVVGGVKSVVSALTPEQIEARNDAITAEFLGGET